MAAKLKNIVADTSYMPQISCEAFPLSEKVKVLYLISKKKYAEIINIHSKNEFYIQKIVKKGK